MSRDPKTIDKDLLLYEAEKLLNEYDINALLVADKNKKLLGVLLFHNI